MPATPAASARRRPGAEWLVLGALLAVAFAYLVHETRGTTFWFDEWEWVVGRRGGGADTFLDPHNQHLSLLPVTIYKLLFAVFGIDDYRPYRAVVLTLHLLATTLLYVYARRRIGAWPAFIPAVVLLFLGPAWQNFLWPFQIGWLGSLTTGLGVLLALDRGDRRGDIAATVLLAASISSSGLGLPIAAGVLVELAWTRSPLRRWMVAAVPLGFYALWSVAYGKTNLDLGNVVDVPRFGADAAAAALGSLAGLAGTVVPDRGDSLAWGRPLAVLATAALVALLVRRGGPSARLAALLAAALAFWALTAMGRSGVASPFASRYIYVGGLLILMIAVEAARDVRVPPAAVGAIVVVAACAVTANLGALGDGAKYLRSSTATEAAELGAMDLVADRVPPLFFPDLIRVVGVAAGPYFAAVDDLGSPAYTPDVIKTAPESARQAADTVLVRALTPDGVLPGTAERPPEAPEPPQVDAITGGEAVREGGCLAFTPTAFRSPAVDPLLAVTLPASGLTLTAADGPPLTVRARNFGDAFPTRPLGIVPGGARATIRLPGLAGLQGPWHLQMEPVQAVRLCAVR